MHDVIVVGGGPTGSYAARRLAEKGFKVVVFEEHDDIGEPMQCTGIVGAECVGRFPLFDGTILREVNSASLFSPSGREIRLRREETQAYIIDRTAFDRALAASAIKCGARYETGSRVIDIEVLGDRVRARCDGGAIHEARAAIIATGFYSRLAQRVGLGRFGGFIAGAQARVAVDIGTEVEIYFDQDIATGFFAWLVPTHPGMALAGLFSRSRPVESLRHFISMLAQKGRIRSEAADISPGGIPLRPLRRTYSERILVVGDAAGQVKPTTGGGVYYGLLCAEIAADTLSRCIASGDLSAEHLSAYQREWHRLIGRELRTGYIARKLYAGLSNGQIDRLFVFIQSRGISERLLQSPDVSFDWHSKAIWKSLQYMLPGQSILSRGGKN